MPHIAGKKVASGHSTVIGEADKLVKFLYRHPLVAKIVTGEIKSIEPGPRRMKITAIEAGLKLMIRGVNARQFLFVYTAKPAIVAEQIEEFWQNKNRSLKRTV
ncbi:MAG: DUF2103 domain-containing protein [Patescibacteria group bacterium]|jgi:hypothetical protein